MNYEITAYNDILKKRSPLLVFHRIKGYSDFEVVTNALGTPQRLWFALGSNNEEEAEKTWEGLMKAKGVPAHSEDAPVKEVVQRGEAVDLFSIPVLKHYPQDGTRSGHGRYITGGAVVSKNPDTGTLNLSFTRIQAVSKNTYAFDCGSKGHLFSYLQKARKKGANAQISVVIGLHPLLYLLAASFIEDEFSIAASRLPLTLTAGIENDLPVPAEAEIVIEAEALADERGFDEGPFSEYTGYVGRDSTRNVAVVKAILRRKKAIYYDVQPSNSREHVSLFTFPRHVKVKSAVRDFMPPISNYEISWPEAASNYLSLASLDNPEPGLAKQLGLLLISLDPLFSKIVLVNEGKVQLSLYAMLANIADSYAHDASDLLKLKNVYCIGSNPTSRGSTSGKLILTGKGRGEYELARRGDEVVITSKDGGGSVVISHGKINEGNVRITIPRGLRPDDEDQLAWALATKVRPETDIAAHPGYLNIKAVRRVGETPKLPKAVIRRVLQALESDHIDARMG